MERLANIEFFKTPDGCVMYKRQGGVVRELGEQDRDLVCAMLSLIRTRYPEAFDALSELYSRSEKNRAYYEWCMVSRFVRCNLGDYDTQTIDIDADGFVRFEQMKCPLMGTGDCRWEDVICKPTLSTGLTSRELELLPLIAEGLQSHEIAERMNIARCTVDHHRQNIMAKLGKRSATELAAWYYQEVKTK